MPAKNKSNINPNADLDDDPSPELVKLPTGANVPDTFQRVNPTITFDTFDEAVPHFSETGEIVVFEGSPYHPVDKKHLVGMPFIIVGWQFYQGNFGPAVGIVALTRDEVPDTNGNRVRRVVINDGSTGMYREWETLCASGKAKAGLVCQNGLRVSEYTYQDMLTGEDKPASTYYFA